MTDISMIESGQTTDQPPRRVAGRAEATLRARAVADSIVGDARKIDQQRCIPDEIMSAIHASGLFALMTPQQYGGSGLGYDALFSAAVELARASGSTGWCYGVLAGHTALVREFPEQTREEVFTNPNVVIASLLRLQGDSLKKVSGGYRLTNGRGKFCSGIDHADWLIFRSAIDGESGLRWFIIPRETIEIIDDWYTVGLQGTGSKSLIVADAFVPEAHQISASATGSDGHELGWGLPLTLCGAAIGTAYAAIEFYRQYLTAKAAAEREQAALLRLASASAIVDSAYLSILDVAAPQPDSDIRPLAPNRMVRTVAFAVQRARDAVNDIFAASGGSSLYTSSRIEQIWRDANAASAHTAFVWDKQGRAAGESLLASRGGSVG